MSALSDDERRQLDIEVAKALGYSVTWSMDDECYLLRDSGGETVETMPEGSKFSLSIAGRTEAEVWSRFPIHYSTDIAAALTLVDMMQMFFNLRNNRVFRGGDEWDVFWCATIKTYDVAQFEFCDARAALAIVRAWLAWHQAGAGG